MGLPKYTDPQRDFIRTLWADGFTAATIAQKFYRAFQINITRNVVIGQANRMGLAPRGLGGNWSAESTVKRLATLKARGIPLGRKPKLPVLALCEAPGGPRPLGLPGESGSGCQWRVGDDPKTWRACGHERVAERPYCSHHAARAYNPQHSR